MRVSATRFPIAVDFKQAGKFYNASNVEGGGSPDPFDTIVVQVGDSFELPAGAELLRVRELTGAAAPGGTPEDLRPVDVPDRADGTAPDMASQISQYDRAGG